MTFQFDWQSKIIEVPSGIVNVEVQDLINEIRTAEATVSGIKQSKIADAAGKDELAPGVLVGITVNLLDNWQVRFAPGNYTAVVEGGNLVGGLAGDPVSYSAGVQVVLIQSAAATIVETGGSALTEEEHDYLMALPSAGSTATAVEAQLSDDFADIPSGVWTYSDRSLTQDIVASGGGLTQEEHDHLLALDTSTLPGIETSIEDALGIAGENVKWSGMAFDSNDYLISAVITQYTDNTLVVERKKWQLTASYDAQGRITSYQLKEY